MHSAAPLFFGWEETMIKTCLQGHMGQVQTDGRNPPESALCAVGDFCFLAGAPNPDLLRQGIRPILVPQTPEWGKVIQAVFGPRARPFFRYAMRKEPETFRPAQLAAYAAALPEGVTLSPLLLEHYPTLMDQNWSKDLCGNFLNGPDFVQRGLGVIALRDGTPVAGAASYTIYTGGIEIEIDTRPDQRRQGLALACGARLILECMERRLYPSWDAHNLRSVALAGKLGYRVSHPYTAYLVDHPWSTEL